MLIYGDIDDRLSSVVTFDPPGSRSNYLLVIHPYDTKGWIEQELEDALRDEHCRGVLIVKGIPRAGLTGERVDELKRRYGSRVHVSCCSVGSREEDSRLAGGLEARFRTFFQHVRSADHTIDWSILDPQWPSNLYSAYMFAKVLSHGDKDAEMIQDQAQSWSHIWEDAKEEYRLLTDKTLAHSLLDMNTAGDIAKQIMEYLQSISARIR